MKRTPLNRRTPLKRRTRLKPISVKRSRLGKKRRNLVVEQLALRPWCEAGPVICDGIASGPYAVARVDHECGGYAVDLHEPLTRARGGSIVDEANTIAICRPCHDWVHDHPAAALALGLLRSGHGQEA